jgi:hypothetical protein
MSIQQRLRKPIAVLLVILIVFMLAACQAAPEQSAVQAKGQGEMQKVIGSTPVPEGQATEFPTDYAFSKDLSPQVSVDISAKVEAEREGGYPVYAIVPHIWSQGEAEDMLAALIGDRQLWAANWGNSVYSKDALDVAILSLKQQLAEETEVEQRAQIQQNILLYEGLYVTAQASRYEAPAERSFSDVTGKQMLRNFENEWTIRGTIDGKPATQEAYEARRAQMVSNLGNKESESIEGIVDLGSGQEAFIQIRRTQSGKNDDLQYHRYDVETFLMETYGQQVPPKPDVTISKEQARAMAQQVIQNLGVDYMVEVTTAQDEAVPSYHWFTYVRAVDGVPMELVSTKDKTGMSYRESWRPESIGIGVDDQGVWYIGWNSPTELREELNANVALLPFERIMEVFQTQAINQFVYTGEDSQYLTHCSYELDRIALNYMAVAKEGTQDEYLLIPVWDFYGRTVLTYSADYRKQSQHYIVDDNNQRVEEDHTYSYMTINALDGTVIDRDLGY